MPRDTMMVVATVRVFVPFETINRRADDHAMAVNIFESRRYGMATPIAARLPE